MGPCLDFLVAGVIKVSLRVRNISHWHLFRASWVLKFNVLEVFAAFLLLLITIELRLTRELWCQFKWIQEERQHVVKFAIELLLFINNVCVMFFGNPAKEVNELR